MSHDFSSVGYSVKPKNHLAFRKNMKIQNFFLNAYLPADNPKKEVREYWRMLSGLLKDTRDISPLLQQWYLQARNRSRALRFQVLENEQGCLEELMKKKEIQSANQNEHLGYFFGLWNGSDATAQGLSLSAALGWRERNFLSLSMPYQQNPENKELFNVKGLLEILRRVERWWKPSWAAVISDEYQEAQALFRDRRGVGWLAYVGTRIEKRSIPEASGIEYLDAGTVVITTYEVFSSEDPRHVEKANRIEARLADLDLLPKK